MENRTLKRNEVGILTVWLGGRLWDASDLHAFRPPPADSTMFVGFQYPFTGTREDVRKCRAVLNRADKHIRGMDMAVFVIATWEVIEFALKRRLYQRHKPNRPLMASLLPKSQLVFNYLIIMDGGKYRSRDEQGPYTENEKTAHKVGGVFLSYNTDAPTAGGDRLTEFISRVMGYDLKSNLFPNYDFETLKKMAWHIKRENFNFFSPLKGAIPKYSFDRKGRPIFDPRLG